jgi:hypothetical protein
MIITDTGPAPPRTLPPGAADLIAAALPSAGRACHLSGLLGSVDTAGSVYLADAATARSLLERGVDPQLYRAYRDVVAPRPKPDRISGSRQAPARGSPIWSSTPQPPWAVGRSWAARAGTGIPPRRSRSSRAARRRTGLGAEVAGAIPGSPCSTSTPPTPN